MRTSVLTLTNESFPTPAANLNLGTKGPTPAKKTIGKHSKTVRLYSCGSMDDSTYRHNKAIPPIIEAIIKGITLVSFTVYVATLIVLRFFFFWKNSFHSLQHCSGWRVGGWVGQQLFLHSLLFLLHRVEKKKRKKKKETHYQLFSLPPSPSPLLVFPFLYLLFLLLLELGLLLGLAILLAVLLLLVSSRLCLLAAMAT